MVGKGYPIIRTLSNRLWLLNAVDWALAMGSTSRVASDRAAVVGGWAAPLGAERLLEGDAGGYSWQHSVIRVLRAPTPAGRAWTA